MRRAAHSSRRRVGARAALPRRRGRTGRAPAAAGGARRCRPAAPAPTRRPCRGRARAGTPRARRAQRRRPTEPEAAERDRVAAKRGEHRDGGDRGEGDPDPERVDVRIECATTGPPGEPRWWASSAPAPVPISQPARLATSVIPTTSVAPTSKICERPAPAHVSRCRTSRWSRRRRVDARIAKPSSSTAASPPRISRRSPATRLVARIAEIVSVGAATVKISVACSSRRLGAVEPRVEACELPVVNRTRRDRDDPAVRARNERRVRQRCALERRTPSASRIGGRFSPPPPKYVESGAPGLNVGAADDVQERQFRRRRRAADLDQLAVGRRARARQAAAAEVEPAREPVDRAEVDERAAPRRLAEHDDARTEPGRGSAATALRASRSSCGYERSDCAGTPLHTAWIARSDGAAARAPAGRRGPAPRRCRRRSWPAPPRRRRCPRRRRSACAARACEAEAAP